VHDLGSPGSESRTRRWRQWRALAEQMERVGRFDAVHGFWADPAGLLASLAGRRFGITSVVTCNSGEFSRLDDIDYGSQRTARGRGVVRTATAFATHVHVATLFMKELAARHGLRAVRIAIGADLSQFSVASSKAPGPPWRLVQVASLNRVKDQRMLLQAVATVVETIDVRLDLVGEDTLDGELHAQAASLGIADRVSFHGYLPNDQLQPIFASAHAYVQSSRHEGAGLAVMEAAASGLPIVGTRVGYVADWQPDAALAVDPQNPEQLAIAIGRVLTDDVLRARLAAGARAIAQAHDVQWTARALEPLYTRAVSGRESEHTHR
jgi:glycosyltransferase involved in cell wall biosynthesis